MFVGIHTMLAMQLNTPELVVDETEADQFLKAAQNVARHYSVETTQKALDWIVFCGACASVYGTRAVAISVRRRAEGGGRRRQRPANAPTAQVYDFHPTGDGQVFDFNGGNNG